MNVNGIGAAGYMTAGSEARKTQRKMAGKEYTDPMSDMVQTTQMPSGTFELHISDDEGGKSIGSICGADYSLTVYQPKDFDPANPVYKVKIWDKSGNTTERMVDVSKVDERNSDYIDMFAYSTYLTASGQCPAAQSVFTMAAANQHGCDSRTYEDLFERTDWVLVLKEAMQTQYDAGNLKGYLEYKKFWDYLDNDAKQAVTGIEDYTKWEKYFADKGLEYERVLSDEELEVLYGAHGS